MQPPKSDPVYSRILSPEIVSLIHHVELNESGWWKKAIGQVVKGGLWKANAALTVSELQRELKLDVGVNVSEEMLQSQLDVLYSQNCVTILNNKYILSQGTRAELTLARKLAQEEQAHCEKLFLAACDEHCPDLDSGDVYREFTRSLQKSVQVSGANLFHLIADGKLEKDVDWLAPFLSKFSDICQIGLRKVLESFFSPENKECRSQILRLLRAYFFAESTQLSKATLAVIEKKRKKRSIKVVLDTNFLFSILQLHNNPGDESALSLVEVAQQSGENFDIALYVLPSTIEEARRVLISQVALIERVRASRAMSRAALTQPLPSIAKKFFEATVQSPGLSSNAFFSPYIDDMRSVLEQKNIKILDAHPNIYHQRQDVIDDVINEMEKEKNELPEQKRKNYETLLHDSVLWHAVRDRRSNFDTSPFEVEYWAVSIDWRLIGFDRQKRLSNETAMPIVLHPSSLIQFVQFWIPRSVGLDNILVDSLRLPLYFQSFDHADERATVKVLEAISRFENVGDFTESTIKIILTNQALRSRLRTNSASNEEVFELVRDELVAEHNRALDKLQDVSAGLEGASQELTRLTDEHKEALSDLQETSLDVQKLNAELSLERDKLKDVESKLEITESSMATRAVEEQNLNDRIMRFERMTYLFLIILVPLILALAIGYSTYEYFLPLFDLKMASRVISAIGFGLCPVIVGLYFSTRFTQRSLHLSEWWVAKRINHLGSRGKTNCWLTFLAVFQGGLWDLIKNLFSIDA